MQLALAFSLLGFPLPRSFGLFSLSPPLALLVRREILLLRRLPSRLALRLFGAELTQLLGSFGGTAFLAERLFLAQHVFAVRLFGSLRGQPLVDKALHVDPGPAANRQGGGRLYRLQGRLPSGRRWNVEWRGRGGRG